MVTTKKERMSKVLSEKNPKQSKRVAVSSKRQISIPKEYFDLLNIGNEVMLELYGNQIIIRPVRQGFDDFSEEILEDLIEEGYSGEKLMSEFKNRKAQLGGAVQSLIEETRESGVRTTIDELFGEENEV